MKNDIFKYDHLNIYAKKSKSKEIIERYKCFNWSLENETENEKYEDLHDLTFVRSHKIENKDDLQLLQIYMEENLNLIGKLEKYKYARSQAFGLFVGSLILALISLSVWFLISYREIKAYFVSSIVMLSLSVVCGIIMAIFLPKILKKEKQNYNYHHNRLENEVNDICKKAQLLSRGAYEK